MVKSHNFHLAIFNSPKISAVVNRLLNSGISLILCSVIFFTACDKNSAAKNKAGDNDLSLYEVFLINNTGHYRIKVKNKNDRPHLLFNIEVAWKANATGISPLKELELKRLYLSDLIDNYLLTLSISENNTAAGSNIKKDLKNIINLQLSSNVTKIEKIFVMDYNIP